MAEAQADADTDDDVSLFSASSPGTFSETLGMGGSTKGIMMLMQQHMMEG